MSNNNETVGRDQILARLWYLASLTPEATKGSIAGQVKALSMIVAIEGLIPDRRQPATQPQPVSPAAKPRIYVSQWMRRQHPEAAEPEEAMEVPPQHPERGSNGQSWATDAGDLAQDTRVNTIGPLRVPIFPKGPSKRNR
jgi:hypothetical protein